MSDNPGDEQRWIPSNEELPGNGTPKPEGIPGSYPPPGGGQSSGKATASLVLGILGFVLCPLVCSILAIVFGYSARNEIDASGGRLGGRGLAVAGIVLGWVGIAFCVLGILFFIALIIIGASWDDNAVEFTTTTVDAIQPLFSAR